MSEARLAVRTVTPAIWQMLREIGPVMHQSRLFGVTSPDAAIAIMCKGYELGLGLAASFEFIQVIEGKPALIPRGALALILNSELLDGMKIKDKPKSCTVWMRRKGGMEYALTYSIQDAENAGLVKPKSNWEKYGPNMCRWRAIGFVADVLFPDVMGGLKRADELGAEVDTDGNVIQGEWTTAPAQPTPAPTPGTPSLTLEDLVNTYGADVIVAANDGAIPQTDEDIARIAAVLAGSTNA